MSKSFINVVWIVFIITLCSYSFASLTLSPVATITSDNNSMEIIVNTTETFTQLITNPNNITYNTATIGFSNNIYKVTLTPLNMSNYTFYASINSTSYQNITLNTGGITGNYVVVNGTTIASIGFQQLLDLLANGNDITLLQETVFRNGVYNITLSSQPVLMYIVTLGNTASANISLYNAENQLISNLSNLYGEKNRNMHFAYNPISNGANNLTNLQVTTLIVNASGNVVLNETVPVTSARINSSNFVLTDYSVHNYTITLYDTVTTFYRTYNGTMTATNIAPTITQLIALRNGQVNSCVTNYECSVKIVVNDDACSVGGQTGFTTFVSANTSLLFNSTTWTYLGETSKNFCEFVSQSWTPVYVDVVNVTANYTDVLSYSSQVNGTMNIGVYVSDGGGLGIPAGTVYEALPEIVKSLNQTTQFYNIYGDSVEKPSPLQVIVERIGEFFNYPVFEYTTQHCLKFSQSNEQYCESYDISQIRVWHLLLIAIVLIVMLLFIIRVIIDYNRLYKYDKEQEKKLQRKL